MKRWFLNKRMGGLMKTIGYMEGTDSDFLTNLLVAGVDTLPLSNGWEKWRRKTLV